VSVRTHMSRITRQNSQFSVHTIYGRRSVLPLVAMGDAIGYVFPVLWVTSS